MVNTLIKKLAPVGIAAAMAAATITPSFAARPHVGNKFSMLVYSHLNAPEIKAIQGLANTWAVQNGGTVKIQADPTTGFQGFGQLARSGRGPDVEFGLPDDNIGTFQLAGLIAPVPGGIYNPTDYVPGAQPAVTFLGQAYAVPLMLDTYTLVYNKKLVKTPPTTFNQVIAIASKFPNKRGQNYGFLFDPTNFYFSYAFIRGCGGYIFKQNGASVDTTNIGLDNAGSVKVYSLFKTLVSKGIIPPDINSDIPAGLFQKGKLGMWIDGDWDIAVNGKALGSGFGVAPLPTVSNCSQSHPFAGVQVAFVNSFSHQKDLAFSLIKYLAPAMQIPDFQVSGRIPAKKAALDAPAIQGDPVYKVYAQSALAGDPLPNVPEMQQVWGPAANNIKLILTGKATPQSAAANMVKQIKAGIAQLKQ